MDLEKFYTFVYDLHFSPCGKFLAACDSYGFITVFNLSKALEPSAVGVTQKYINKWKGDSGPLYCFASNDTILFSGGENGVKGWAWKNITKLQKSTDDIKPTCNITLKPLQSTGFSDVNYLVIDDKSNILYIACGNSVFCWNIETETFVSQYDGHMKYIHSISLRPSTTQFLTAAEDGTVKLWDAAKSSDPLHTINCSKESTKMAENWVSSVAVDDSGEWMVFGGSTPPTLYKLGSMSEVAIFDVPEKVTTQTIMFTKGRIISGGSENIVRHWTMNGESIIGVPSNSQSHILAIKHNTANPKYEVLAVSGDSSFVDIFTNFGYRAFCLSVH